MQLVHLFTAGLAIVGSALVSAQPITATNNVEVEPRSDNQPDLPELWSRSEEPKFAPGFPGSNGPGGSGSGGRGNGGGLPTWRELREGASTANEVFRENHGELNKNVRTTAGKIWTAFTTPKTGQ